MVLVALTIVLLTAALAGAAFAASSDTVTLNGVWNFNDSLSDNNQFFNAEVGTVRDVHFQSFAVYDGELRPLYFSYIEFTGSVLYYRAYDASCEDIISYTVWTSADGWLDDCYKQVFFYRSVVPGGFPDWLAENAAQPVSNVSISGCWQFKPYSEFDVLKPDNKFIYQEVEFWQSKTFETAYAISFRPWFDFLNPENYFIDGHNSDGSYKVGLADTGWWGEFGRFRLVDFGSTPQLVSQDFYDLMSTCADPVNRSDFFPVVSGEWTWNDTLPDFQVHEDCEPFFLSQPVTVNGVSYGCALVLPAGSVSSEFGVSVLLVHDLYSDDPIFTPVYLEGIGWLDGSVTFSDEDLGNDADTILASLVPGTQMQTWDFGSGSEQPVDFVNYMTANATQPGAEPSTVTIPAGTYRFNDVLSVFTEDIEQELSFVCSGYVDDVFAEADCAGIWLYYEVDSDGEVSHYYKYFINTLTANGETVAVGYENVYSGGDWRFPVWKTITLPEDAEVSTEFYEWFTANAAEVVDDGSTDDGNGDTGGTGSGGDNSGSTGDGSGSGGDTGSGSGDDSGTGGDTGSGDTSGDGSTCDHSGVIGWLEKIWQSIKDGFDSVLSKLEELVGLSSDSPSESALKDASSGVIDTVTDLFYGEDTEDTSTDSGSDGSSSGSGGSKFKKDDAKELSNISGRVKSWFAFDADIGELFDIVEGGSDWYSEETANGIDSTVSVATYGRDSDPYSMQDYYQYIDYLFARYGGDAE